MISSCRGSERREMGVNLLAFGNSQIKYSNMLFNINKFPMQHARPEDDNILKQIKFEERHEKMFSNDIHRDVQASKLLSKTTVGEFGLIQEISQDPFGYLVFSELQV
jgi:hypothetical protein